MAVKKSAVDSFFEFVQKPLSNVFNKFSVGVNNPLPQPFDINSVVKNKVKNSVQSFPFDLKTSVRSNPPVGALSVDTKKLNKQFNQDMQTYQKASPVGKLGLENILGEGSENPLTKGASGQFKPYIRDTSPAPKSDPSLERIKMKVLSNPNLTPAAKNYLSKIPVSFEKYRPNKEGRVPAGASYGSSDNGIVYAQNPYITISDKFKNPPSMVGIDPFKTPEEAAIYKKQAIAEQTKALETVIVHELNHQAPRLVPVELFHPKNKVIIDQYVQRWGEKYMKNPGYLVEEMFAEQALPPAYYYHVFKSINPKASQQDFVGYLKSFFINKINTPAPVVQNIGGRPTSRTIVPNSGGQIIQP
ncbi:hypothetical protein M0R04_15105 [Candidatus Dojkabacteria bacterium]|jgi:hypothetical protein|nr:hypothetical protein [Candidatus Dojkabacteria bacterium]